MGNIFVLLVRQLLYLTVENLTAIIIVIPT